MKTKGSLVTFSFEGYGGVGSPAEGFSRASDLALGRLKNKLPSQLAMQSWGLHHYLLLLLLSRDHRQDFSGWGITMSQYDNLSSESVFRACRPF